MITAFRVFVSLDVGHFRASKEITEQKVLTMTEKYVTFDEMGTKVRVPRSEVYLSREEAEKAAQEKANELICKLVGCVASLKDSAISFHESPELSYLRQREREQA